MIQTRKTPAARTTYGLIWLFLAAFTFLCFYPFYYLIIYTFSDASEAARGLSLLPKGLTLKNIQTVLTMDEIPHAMLMSVLRTVCASGLTLIGSSFFAYLMTKREMYLRTFFYRLCVVSMYVGGGLIPTYLVYRAYGLTNTFWVYILPGMVTPYYVILIKTYMESIPRDMEEAATIDGANLGTIFFKIILPLSKPILVVVAIFAVSAAWSDFLMPYLLLGGTSKEAVMVKLYSFHNSIKTNQIDIIRAVLYSIIPPTILFGVFQKQIMGGVMSGGIKG